MKTMKLEVLASVQNHISVVSVFGSLTMKGAARNRQEAMGRRRDQARSFATGYTPYKQRRIQPREVKTLSPNG